MLEHTDIDFLSAAGRFPWWYATVNWTALHSDSTVADLGGDTGRLLRLAVSIAAGNRVDPHDVLVDLGPEYAQMVDLSVTTGGGERLLGIRRRGSKANREKITRVFRRAGSGPALYCL